LPSISGYKPNNVMFISDNLFNSDNNVEALLILSTTTGARPYYRSVLIDEFGAILYDFDSSFFYNIYTVDGRTKLMASSGFGNPISYHSKVYALPGFMPCGGCGGVGVPKYSGEGNAEISSPMPNPNSGVDNYQL